GERPIAGIGHFTPFDSRLRLVGASRPFDFHQNRAALAARVPYAFEDGAARLGGVRARRAEVDPFAETPGNGGRDLANIVDAVGASGHREVRRDLEVHCLAVHSRPQVEAGPEFLVAAAGCERDPATTDDAEQLFDCGRRMADTDMRAAAVLHAQYLRAFRFETAAASLEAMAQAFAPPGPVHVAGHAAFRSDATGTADVDLAVHGIARLRPAAYGDLAHGERERLQGGVELRDPLLG